MMSQSSTQLPAAPSSTERAYRLPKVSPRYVKECLDYNPETGLLTWKYRPSMRAQWNGIYCGRVAGCAVRSGHIRVALEDKPYQAHWLAWAIMTGEWPECEVDHKDGDPSNNKWENLRAATSGQNNYNAGPRSHNTSGYKGVSFHKQTKKWRATIKANKKLHHLGLFHTKEEAYSAYVLAAERLHGQFARVA